MFRIVAVLMSVLFFAGCATLSGSSMSRLKIGMEKDVVVKKIGKPDFVTASRTAAGEPQEVWEYTTHKDDYNETKVWFVFSGSQLVAWGDAKNFTTYDPSAVLKNDFLPSVQGTAVAQQGK